MPLDMNKTIAEASLNNLNDILVPDAPGFLPLASGWYFVLLLLFTLSLHFAYRLFLEYRRNKYKRDALEALPRASSTETVLSLAKRVGISAYGREKTATLSGDDWWEFMQKYSHAKIDITLRKEIEKSLYDTEYVLKEKDKTTLRAFVKVWINTHRRDAYV